MCGWRPTPAFLPGAVCVRPDAHTGMQPPDLLLSLILFVHLTHRQNVHANVSPAARCIMLTFIHSVVLLVGAAIARIFCMAATLVKAWRTQGHRFHPSPAPQATGWRELRACRQACC